MILEHNRKKSIYWEGVWVFVLLFASANSPQHKSGSGS